MARIMARIMRSRKQWATLAQMTRFLVGVLAIGLVFVLIINIQPDSLSTSSSTPLIIKLQEAKSIGLSIWEPNDRVKGEFLYMGGPFCSEEPCRLSFPLLESSADPDSTNTAIEGGSPHSILITEKGKKGRVPNQDRSLLIQSKDDNFMLAAVFDGHGLEGHLSSEQALRDLPFDLLNQAQFQSEPDRILQQCFLRADKVQAFPEAGTTAVIAVQMGTAFYLASAGDSIGLLVRYNGNDESVEIIAKAFQHKPAVPTERARIERAGGHVITPEGATSRVVYTNANGFEMGLAMSRSLGDQDGKSPGYLLADPSIVSIPNLSVVLNNNNNKSGDSENSFLFVIVASDGVMDMLPMEQVTARVAKALVNPSRTALTAVCQELMLEAAANWDRQMQGNYRDDMTLVVTRLYF